MNFNKKSELPVGYVNEFQRADEGSVPQAQMLSACDGERRLVLAVQMGNKCNKSGTPWHLLQRSIEDWVQHIQKSKQKGNSPN